MKDPDDRPWTRSVRTIARWLCGAVVAWSAPSLGDSIDTTATQQRLSQMRHAAWRTQEGLFPSSNTIGQTRDGYFWLGTNRGVHRFDGVRFVSWNAPGEGLSADWNVTALLAARDNSLWVGTSVGIVARLKDGKVKRYVTGGAIAQLSEDAAGTIWMAVRRGSRRMVPLCRVVGDDVECVPAEDLPMDNASAVLAADDGAMWVGNSSKLCRWQTGRATSCFLEEALKPRRNLVGVVSIVPAGDGALWVGTGRGGPDLGLGQWQDGKWKRVVVHGFDLSTLAVSSMMKDRTGALWVGTIDRGLYRIGDQRIEHFDSASGLTGDSISDNGVFEDRHGTVWVVTSAGLDAFSTLPVSVFSTRQGVGSGEVDAVLPTRDGAVWFGGVPLTRLVGDDLLPPPAALRSAGGDPTAMLEDHAGRLWIGLNNTLNVMSDGPVVRVPGPDGRETGAIEDMEEDAEHRVWVKTVGVDSRVLRFADPAHAEHMADPRYAGVQAMKADDQGGIWFGYGTGALAYSRGAQWTAYPANLVKRRIRQIEIGPDGTVLAATADGLIVQKEGRQFLLSSLNGLPGNRIFSLIVDRHDDLWLLASSGLVRIRRADLADWLEKPSGTIRVRVFDETDGVNFGYAAFTPHASRGPDGRLWFPTGKVAQVIDPDRLDEAPPAPPVVIEEAVAGGTPYPSIDGQELPARTRDVEIRYTALTSITPQRIRFRYRLDGHEQDWHDAGTRRSAFYNDLPPGRYRFLVEAASSDGHWSNQPAAVEFTTLPLFHQTAWFKALCIAAVVALVYGLYLFRIGQLERRLRDRMETKNAERERIARELHDTLLQSTQSLVYNFQAVANDMDPQNAFRTRIERMLERADSVITEGRDRVLDLRLPAESLADLPEALNAIFAEVGTANGPTCRSMVDGRRRPLDPRVHDALYRIGRETLLNAFRHAQATTIEVRVVYGDDEVCLSIHDDGRGIDAETLAVGSKPGHWGLKGLHERARGIGASLRIESVPGAGTQVTVKVDAATAYRDRTRSRWSGLLPPFGRPAGR